MNRINNNKGIEVVISKYEQGLGGGEGSIITYYFDCGDKSVPLATSRNIKGSHPEKKWVKELDFMYSFVDFSDLKRELSDCENPKLAEYISRELIQ